MTLYEDLTEQILFQCTNITIKRDLSCYVGNYFQLDSIHSAKLVFDDPFSCQDVVFRFVD